MKILSIKVRHRDDTDPDLSYLGEYSDKPGPDDRTIDRVERGDASHGQYRYFIATRSGDETGNPESVEQDYKRMETYGDAWYTIGIDAIAEVQLTGNTVQRITSGGLWGIESDSDTFEDIESDQLADLGAELRAIGFTQEQIDAVNGWRLS